MADQVLQSPTNPHFFQPLLPGFHSHLSIPLKFYSEYIEGRNEKITVELKSDACEKTWKVKMEGCRLTVGWEEFTVAHDFRIGDIIIFRHKGDLVFHVTSFGPSCCEIQYVQDKIRNLSTKQNLKTEPEDDDKDNMRKFPRKKHEKKRKPEAEAESFPSDQSCFVARVTDSNLRDDTLFFSKKLVWFDGLNKRNNKIVLMDEGVRTWTLNLKFRESSRTFYMNRGWRSFCHENGLQSGDSIKFKLERNNTKTHLLRFSTSESKCVSTNHSSKGKKRKTGESSQRVSSSSSSPSGNRFVTLTVTPTDIRNSSLYLPRRFTTVNKMENAIGKKITMLDKNGVKWPVNLQRERGYTRLGSGFNKFLKANGVKASESFVLEFVWEDTTTAPMLKFCAKVKT